MKFSTNRPIPPGSKVRLSRYDDNTPDWKDDVGRFFLIGYYNRNDGLDVVWLINERGDYEQTSDQASFGFYFEVLELSHNKDFFGLNVPPGTLPST